MKFNEVYLGESGLDTPEFQDGGGSPQSGGGGGGGGGAGGGPLSLEQYICNAREALGVDSNYSRFVLLFFIMHITQRRRRTQIQSNMDVQRQRIIK